MGKNLTNWGDRGEYAGLASQLFVKHRVVPAYHRAAELDAPISETRDTCLHQTHHRS